MLNITPENVNDTALSNAAFFGISSGKYEEFVDFFDDLPSYVRARYKEGALKKIFSEAKKKATGYSVAEDYETFVAEMNKTHALVRKGGTTYVAVLARDENGNPAINFYRPKEYSYFWLKTPIVVGVNGNGEPKVKDGLNAWLSSPNCRQYDGVIFDPYRADMERSDDEVNGFLNLFSGYAVTAKEVKAAKGITAEFPTIDEHIIKVLAGGNSVNAKYIYDWCAYALQNPDVPQKTALVFTGGKRIGKSLFAKFFASLWGSHGIFTSSPEHLIGRFTSHLMHTSVLVLDEGYNPRDRRQESAMKSILTEELMAVEGKFQDVQPARNAIKVIITSNDEHVVAASGAETRFAVFGVSDVRRGDREYFEKLVKEMASREAMAGFIKYCLNRDISRFSPEDIPQTGELLHQKLMSLNNVQRFLLDVIERGGFVQMGGTFTFPEKISGSEAHQAFLEWCDAMSLKQYDRMTATAFGIELSKYMKKGRNHGGSFYHVNRDNLISAIAERAGLPIDYLLAKYAETI